MLEPEQLRRKVGSKGWPESKGGSGEPWGGGGDGCITFLHSPPTPGLLHAYSISLAQFKKVELNHVIE